MVDKKEVIDGWPLESGDYAIGDVQCPVAVVSLGSKINDELVQAGAAIAGPLHTENLGIEKLVTNIVSNSNLRFLIICGSEVQGHITGKTVEALYENGIDKKTKTIIGSPGAIPFVENLPFEAVERFQEQISIVSMIDNENIDEISVKINECISNDPGAFSDEAMIVRLNDNDSDDEEDDDNNQQELSSSSASMDSNVVHLLQIQSHIKFMDNTIKQIGCIEKFSSGYYAGKIEGIVIGFICTLLLLILIGGSGLL